MQTAKKDKIGLGKYYSYWLERSPRRFLYHLTYYRFAAAMIGKKKRVLDIGCNEGLGTRLLSQECGQARGVDLDREAIEAAKENWSSENCSFFVGDILKTTPGQWDAVTNFDVIEHIFPSHMEQWWSCITSNLVESGVAIIGTPSLTSKKYASAITNKGHINLYSAERLKKEMSEYFHQVFIFAANDEVIHTGFLPLAHYYIVIGAQKRSF